MKKLKLNSDTVRTLTSAELTLAAGGVDVDIYTGGDETAGHPGCESSPCPGTTVCSVGCSGTVPRCPPWPDPG